MLNQAAKDRLRKLLRDRFSTQSQPATPTPGSQPYFTEHAEKKVGSPFITQDPEIEMDHDITPDVMTKVFGSVPHPHDLAAMASSVDGAKIRLMMPPNADGTKTLYTSARLKTPTSEHTTYRTFYPNGHVNNSIIFVKNSPASGKSAHLLRAQAEALAAHGFKKILANCAGDPNDFEEFKRTGDGYIGYFQWPKLGFQAPLSQRVLHAMNRSGYTKLRPGKVANIIDHIEDPRFYDLWKHEHGEELDNAFFDLSPHSKSWQLLKKRTTDYKPVSTMNGNQQGGNHGSKRFSRDSGTGTYRKTGTSSAPAGRVQPVRSASSGGDQGGNPPHQAATGSCVGRLHAGRDRVARFARAALSVLQRFAAAEGSGTPKADTAPKAPTFYSHAERVISSKVPGSAHPDQVKKTLLNNSVKPEEMQYSGIQDHLANASGPVKKQDLLGLVKKNTPKIGEVMLGEDFPEEDPDVDWAHRDWQVDGDGGYTDEDTGEWVEDTNPTVYRDAYVGDRNARNEKKYRVYYNDDAGELYIRGPGGEEVPHNFRSRRSNAYRDAADSAEVAIQAYARKLAEEESGSAGPTKYEDWTLPGGKNYRELLLTLPKTPEKMEYPEPLTELPDGFAASFNRAMNPENQWSILPEGQTHGRPYAGRHASKEEAEAAALQRLNQERNVEYAKQWHDRNSGSIYNSSHWNEPNVLAHIRFNDRTGPNGEKLLHVEEVQSDWHQDGRKKGYRQKPVTELPEGYRIRKEDYGNGTVYGAVDPQGYPFGSGGRTPEEATRNAIEHLNAANSRVPDAPFKKTWHELALRRIMRYAAEHGYDGVTWTPGDQQAERYNMMRHVGSVAYKKDADGSYVVKAKRPNGDRIDLGTSEFSKEELVETFGKELADKIIAGEGKPSESGKHTVLDGMDLKVGGEGMRGFYDKIIPDYLQKYLRKFGSGVGQTEIRAGKNKVTVPFVPIMPEMKKAVLHEGQALFSRRGRKARFKKTYNDIFRDATLTHFGGESFQAKLAKLNDRQRDKHHQGLKKFLDADHSTILRSIAHGDEDRAHDLATRILFGSGDEPPAFFAKYKPEEGNLLPRFVAFATGYNSHMNASLRRHAAIPLSGLRVPESVLKLKPSSDLRRSQRPSRYTPEKVPTEQFSLNARGSNMTRKSRFSAVLNRIDQVLKFSRHGQQPQRFNENEVPPETETPTAEDETAEPETWTCPHCNTEHDDINDDGESGSLVHDANGDPACTDCHSMCGNCLEYADNDDLEDVRGEPFGHGWRRNRTYTPVCSTCRNDDFFQCGDCNELTHNSRSGGENTSGDTVCENCGQDYFTCNSCNDVFHNDDYGENGECQNCSGSADNESNTQAVRSIHPYSYDPPDWIEHGNPNDKKFGTELETIQKDGDADDLREKAEFVLDGLNEGVGDEEFAFLKRDSSLYNEGTGSFEIVTHPATLDEHKKRWVNVLDGNNPGLASGDTGVCGLHIHVGRKGLSDLAIGKMRALVNAPDNQKFMAAIARRTSSYAELDPNEKLTEGKKPRTGRYRAINLQNKHTIEFRLFKGTLKSKVLFRSLEFVDAVTEFCKTANTSIQKATSLPDFFDFVLKNPKERPNLAEFVAKYAADNNIPTTVKLKPKKEPPKRNSRAIVSPAVRRMLKNITQTVSRFQAA